MPRSTRKPFVAVVILAMVAALMATVVGGTPAAADDPEVDYWLTVLHNNDGESDLLPDEVDGVPGGEEGGVALFQRVVRRAMNMERRKIDGVKRGVVMVSSGDNFLAGPEWQASIDNGVFYDAIALSNFRYDAIILGNHDFDFGPDVLADFISSVRRVRKSPYLSINLDFSGEPALQALADRNIIRESKIFRERGELIGIIGATTPNLPFISSPRNVVVDPDVAALVQAEIDRMEGLGVDKIIFVSHLQGVDEDIALAEMLSGVDVMVAGGGDELLASPGDPLLPSDDPADVFGPYPLFAMDADGNDVPVVTTSGSYGYLGQLVVGFDADGNVVAVDDGRSRPVRVVNKIVGRDGVNPSPKLQNLVEDPVQDFVDGLAAQVIGNSQVALDGTRANVRSRETNEGNLIADSLLWQAQQLAAGFGADAPQVALQNGGGIRNDSVIPAGPITELDTFSMVPFPNFVTIVEDVPRDVFLAQLEDVVSRIDASGAAVGEGTGRFAQIGGFEFSYDSSVPPGGRIIDVTVDGVGLVVDNGVVVPGDPIDIATIDFLARGGDEYDFGGQPFTVLGVSYQQALSNYIVDALGGTITAADYPEGGEGRIVRVN